MNALLIIPTNCERTSGHCVEFRRVQMNRGDDQVAGRFLQACNLFNAGTRAMPKASVVQF